MIIQAPAQPKKKEKKKKNLWLSSKTLCLLAVPLLIFTIFVVQKESQSKIQDLTQKKEEALAKQTQLIHERDTLKYRTLLLSNPDYFANYAKKKLLYSADGELLFLFPSEY